MTNKTIRVLAAVFTLTTATIMTQGLSPAAIARAEIVQNTVADRGRLIRSDFLLALTRDEVAQGLATIGWSDAVVKTGVALYRIIYTTIDAQGAPTTAS